MIKKIYQQRSWQVKKEKVRAIIFERGTTQRKIAIEAKIPESRLSHFINGRQELTPRERRSLARVLKITESALDEPTAFSVNK